jgi:hypothetical protein
MRYLFIVVASLFLSVPSLAYEETDWENYAREVQLAKRASLLRIGIGAARMQDSELDSYHQEGSAVMLDYLFYRHRSVNIERRASGFDFYSRFTYRHFVLDGDPIAETEIDMISLDIGARHLWGGMHLDRLCQFYILAAPRFLHYKEEAGGKENTLYSLGIIGGIGVEIALSATLGFFVEYNQGYTPVGDSDANVEGIQILFGMTLRTPL